MTGRVKREPLLWLVLLLSLPALYFCLHWLVELRQLQQARLTLLPQHMIGADLQQARVASTAIDVTLARLGLDDAAFGTSALTLRRQREQLERHWRAHRQSIVEASEIVLARQGSAHLQALDQTLAPVLAALDAARPAGDVERRAAEAAGVAFDATLTELAKTRLALQQRNWQQFQSELDSHRRQLLWRLGAVLLLQLALAGWLFLPPVRAGARTPAGETQR